MTQFLREFVTHSETGCSLPCFVRIFVLNQMNTLTHKHPAGTIRISSIPPNIYQFLIFSMRSTRPSVSSFLYLSDQKYLLKNRNIIVM